MRTHLAGRDGNPVCGRREQRGNNAVTSLADNVTCTACRRDVGTPAEAPPVTGIRHRGVITASRPGPACLCGESIRAGQSIVKRWRRWIHVDCYDAILSAKAAITG